METRKNSIIIILIFFQITLCYSQNEWPLKDTLHYLFMGHIYEYNTAGDKVDHRVEQMDKTGYDGIWLGGDVCSEALLKYSTVRYIDSLFDLGDPMTFWTLGNHDVRNGNFEWLKEFTGRETYYAHYQNGITIIIMNTNLIPTNCEDMDNQFQIITNVCDTITHSSHLFLIMHHGIWRGVPNLPNPATYAQSDLIYWNSNCDSVNSTFVNSIYPMLLDVKNRGIEVICILGDMGSQHFNMDSEDGVHFMGCGLHNSSVDEVLIFEHIVPNRTITWGFYNLDSLINTQK
jgi:hypothetical protein